MDKKNTIIGVLLLLAAFYFMYDSSSKEAEAARAAAIQQQVAPSSPVRPTNLLETAPKAESLPTDKQVAETIVSLKNDKIKVNFTNFGAAIRNVEMFDYAKAIDSSESFVFNNIDNRAPAMGFATFGNFANELPISTNAPFKLIEQTSDSLTFERVVGNFKITRKYSLVSNSKLDAAPYTIATATAITNLSDKPQSIGEFYLCLGAVSPTESDVYGSNQSVALYSDGDCEFLRASSFVSSSGFLGMGASAAKPFEKLSLYPISWAAVKNQFFVSVFTPEKIFANAAYALPISVNDKAENKYMRNAIAGYVGFNAGIIEPQKSWELAGSFYVGPKSLDNLYSLGANQDDIMDYGWFGFVSRPLSRLMNWIHSLIVGIAPEWGWGWSIIILTIIVRSIIWPLTSIQIKSSQRMSKLQEPLKAIREKFKDDPKRINQETMKLYSEYGINPLAGCLPVFIQIPIFIGLYYMLQTSCEIRFAHFLWIDDLARPDTIAALPTIFGFPLHVLPLINAAITFIQMSLTPTPSTDKAQAWMFKLMPVIMLVFFYTFPSGLILYWTAQSFIGLIQAIIIRRGADKVVLKKTEKKRSGFMQRMQEAFEQAQAAQAAKGADYEKLSLKEKLRMAREDAVKARQKIRDDRLKGTMYETRKKNPGGRSTPKKRK